MRNSVTWFGTCFLVVAGCFYWCFEVCLVGAQGDVWWPFMPAFAGDSLHPCCKPTVRDIIIYSLQTPKHLTISHLQAPIQTTSSTEKKTHTQRTKTHPKTKKQQLEKTKKTIIWRRHISCSPAGGRGSLPSVGC